MAISMDEYTKKYKTQIENNRKNLTYLSAAEQLKYQKNKEAKAKQLADNLAQKNNINKNYVDTRNVPTRATALQLATAPVEKYGNVNSTIEEKINNKNNLLPLNQGNKYEILDKKVNDIQKKYTDYYNSDEYQNYVKEYYKTPLYQYNADVEKVSNQDKFSKGEKLFTSFFGGLRSAMHMDRQYKTTDSNGKTVYVDLPNLQQLKAQKLMDNTNSIGKIYQEAMASIGQMVPSITAGAVTGGLGLSTELGSLGVMAINAYSGSKNQMLLDGYSKNQAETYGALSAAVEVATEKMFGGLGKLMGTGALDEVITEKLTKNITNRVVKGLAELGISSIGEGVEEVVSGLAQPIIQKLALGKKEDYLTLLKDESLSEDFFAGVLSSAIIGGVTGVGKGINNKVNVNNQNVNIQETNNIQNELKEDKITSNNTDIIQNNNNTNNNQNMNINSNSDINSVLSQINELKQLQSNNELNLIQYQELKKLQKQLSVLQEQNQNTEITQNTNSQSTLKEQQNNIIQNTNPVNDDYHTWIRSVDDIKTFSEALNDSDYKEYFEAGEDFDETYTADMAKMALETGKITIYSSYPIEQGTFVSPSKMEAESYSGTGKVYSKEVNLTDVAWIDPTQGQYAKVSEDNSQNTLNSNKASYSIPIGKYQYVESDNANINALRKSASIYLNNTMAANNTVSLLESIIKDKNYAIKFNPNITNEQGVEVAGKISKENGQISIELNPNVDNYVEFLVIHEITHDIATKEMKELILDYAKQDSEFNDSLETLKKRYKTDDVSDEVVADVCGELFGNREFIQSVVEKKPNIFKKILNNIRKLAEKIKGTGANEYVNFVEKLKTMWEDAYYSNQSNLKETKYMMTGFKGMQNGINANVKYQDIKNRYNMALKLKSNGYSNEDIRQMTGWFNDTKENWKFEISDTNTHFIKKPIENNSYKLSDIFEAKTLYEMYPELKNIIVEFKKLKGKNGSYNSSNEKITLNNQMLNNLNNLKGTLLHEIQHYIQHEEKFPAGTTILFGNENYANNLGEIEATDTKNRRNLSVSERKSIVPESAKENPIHPNKEAILNRKRNTIEKIAEKLYNLLGDKSNELFEENDIETTKMDVSENSKTDSNRLWFDERYDVKELNNSSFSIEDVSTYVNYEFTPADLKAINKIIDDVIWHVDNYGEYQQSDLDEDICDIPIIRKLIDAEIDFEDYEFNINEKILDIIYDKLNEVGIDSRYIEGKDKYVFDRQELATKGYNEMLDFFDKNNINYEVSKSTNAGYVPSIYIKDSDGDVIYRIANHENGYISDFDMTYNDSYNTLYSDSDYANWKENIIPKIEEEIGTEYNLVDLVSQNDKNAKYSIPTKEWNTYLKDNFPSSGTKTKMNDIVLPMSEEVRNSSKNKTLNPIEISQLKPEDANTTPFLPGTKRNTTGDGESKFYDNIKDKTDMLNEEQKNAILSSDEVKYYDKITNKESLNEAFNKLEKGGQLETNRWFKKESKDATATDVAEGWILLKQYADKSQNTTDLIEKNYYNEAMVEVAKKMRDIGTKAGQTVQAFNIMERMSPEGMVKYAQSELSEAYNKMVQGKTKEWIDKYRNNFELTADDVQFIMDTMQEVSTMEDGYDKKVKLAQIQKLMTDKLPPQRGAKIKSWMRISMLFNPKTQVRNVAGNALIMPVNAFGDLFSSYTDKIIARKTGVRTTGNTNIKAMLKGMKRGAYEATNDYKMGINTKDMDGNRFEISNGKSFSDKNIVGKTLNRTESLLNYVMDVGDRVFSEASFENSLQNQMVLNNTTEITQEIIDIAHQEALSRTWNDNNNYTKFVLNARSGLNQLLNFKGYGLGDVLIPFAKTPANLTKAIAEYSPVGLVSTLKSGINLNRSLTNGQYTAQMQHDFVQKLGKATAGTMLYVLGVALAKAGITIGESDDDKDTRNFLQNALGISSYSIKIGDKTFTYDWAQPLAAPLSITANVVNSNSNKETALLEAILGSLDTAGAILLEQSFLQSINDVLTDNDGFVSGLITEILELPARAIPTFSKQIADMVDGTKRQTFEYDKPIKSAYNYAKSKIPGLSKTLAPSVDTMGREIQKYGGKNNIFNVFLNPANVNTENISESAKEIYRLYEETGDTTIMPRIAPYYINKNNEKITLNSTQRAEYQKVSGKIIEDSIQALLKNSQYKNMSDVEKSDIINNIVNYSYNVAQSEVLGTEISSTYEKAYLYSKVGNVYDYYIFKSQEFTSDKDKNGKTISGSKKKKIIKYINSMNISAVNKAILIKFNNYSVEGYDKKIINYINNQNLTKEEKSKILTELGYTIKNGKVYVK